MKTRKEFDSIGSIQVPAEKYWGASTERSNKFFNIGKILIDGDYPFGLIKFKELNLDTTKLNTESGSLKINMPNWISF